VLYADLEGQFKDKQVSQKLGNWNLIHEVEEGIGCEFLKYYLHGALVETEARQT
jgi:hypothetical protein